jgi:hypothetical protein
MSTDPEGRAQPQHRQDSYGSEAILNIERHTQTIDSKIAITKGQGLERAKRCKKRNHPPMLSQGTTLMGSLDVFGAVGKSTYERHYAPY